MSDGYDGFDRYLDDTYQEYGELVESLSGAVSTEDFKNRLVAINGLMGKHPDVFGENSSFIHPPILENLEAVKGIEKVWRQQKRDSGQNMVFFVISVIIAVVSFFLGRFYN